jgi:hypothetical protein
MEIAQGIESFFQACPWCRPSMPYPWVYDDKSNRRLTKDGRVIIRPWTNDYVETALLKAMPGAAFNAITREWQVSTAKRDRFEIIRLAHRLNLSIEPGFPKEQTNDRQEL